MLSVALDEKDKSKLIVIGEDMDTFELMTSLRKKHFRADMESLEEVKSEKKDEGQKKPEEKMPPWQYIYHPNLPQHMVCHVPVAGGYGYDYDPCSIM